MRLAVAAQHTIDIIWWEYSGPRWIAIKYF